MKRFLYRLLVWSHPQRFREQFGGEMISIFDQLGPRENTELIADGILSLLRQLFVRSNLWKMAAGAAISSLVICGWAYSVQRSMEASLRVEFERSMKLQWDPPSAGTQLDTAEFRRATSSAVAILAEIRRKEEQERRMQRRPTGPGQPTRSSAATITAGERRI
jgi:hypothetical protein